MTRKLACQEPKSDHLRELTRIFGLGYEDASAEGYTPTESESCSFGEAKKRGLFTSEMEPCL